MAMHNIAELVRSLAALPRETEWVEFKDSKFVQDSIGQYVSGLANSAMFCGQHKAYLVFGIEDVTHRIIGTDLRLDAKKVGNDSFLFWLNGRLSPQINIEHATANISGKHVELLCIDPGYHHPVRFNGKAYIRIDTSLQPLEKHPERERAVWQATSRFSFEESIAKSHISAEVLFKDFDVNRLVGDLGYSRPNNGSIVDVLVQEGLVHDNLQGGLDVTNLLVLTASNDMRQYPGLSRKGVRVITYSGKSKLNTVNDTEGRRGYATTFSSLLKFVMEKIPHKEQMLHGRRITVHNIPELAVREILANAIIHQDLTAPGDGPVVEIYPDKVKVSNPGRPLIPTDRFIDSPSRSRNERFGHLMRRLGLCEERGSGVDRALTEIERNVLPPPLFQQVEDATVVTLYGPVDFADMSRSDRIRACYQHACLGFEKNDYMSNGSLRKRFGLSDKQYPQVSLVIGEAREEGVIRPLDEDQGNRNARYVPYWA